MTNSKRPTVAELAEIVQLHEHTMTHLHNEAMRIEGERLIHEGMDKKLDDILRRIAAMDNRLAAIEQRHRDEDEYERQCGTGKTATADENAASIKVLMQKVERLDQQLYKVSMMERRLQWITKQLKPEPDEPAFKGSYDL